VTSPGYSRTSASCSSTTFAVSSHSRITRAISWRPCSIDLASRTESAARFNALQARVITEIDRAVAVYHATQENLATLEALAADQKKQAEAVTAQAKAGAADELDLLHAQLELSAGALVQLDGRIKAQQAYGALEDALQRPLEALKPSAIEQRHAQATKEKLP